MQKDANRWRIEIDKERFDKLKAEERFWQLVTLSRAVNALRFVQAALLGHQLERMILSAHSARETTRFSSIVRCSMKHCC